MTNAQELVTVFIQQATPITNLVNSISATVHQYYELRDGQEEYVQLGSRFYQRESILSFWIEGEYPERPLRDYPTWVQPEALLTAYSKGDRVLYGEAPCVWESIIDNNNAEPSETGFGWICLDGEHSSNFTLALVLHPDLLAATGTESGLEFNMTYEELSKFLKSIANEDEFIEVQGVAIAFSMIWTFAITATSTDTGTEDTGTDTGTEEGTDTGAEEGSTTE